MYSYNFDDASVHNFKKSYALKMQTPNHKYEFISSFKEISRYIISLPHSNVRRISNCILNAFTVDFFVWKLSIYGKLFWGIVCTRIFKENLRDCKFDATAGKFSYN